MTAKKILSLLLALIIIVSAAMAASAESANATTGETATGATAAAETVKEEAAAEVYTLDEMLTRAMADAYARQAAYAAYAEAYPNSRSLGGADTDTQIILLEMLLKANGVALPADTTAVTAPGTKAEAYAEIAAAESNAYTMYRTFLAQETLPDDAKIIFHSVLQPIGRNARSFARKAQNEMWAAQWQKAMEGGETKVYEFDNGRGHGTLTVYTYSSDDQASETDEAAEPAEATDETIREDSAEEMTGE
jgi:hypothetical protein